MLQVIVTYGSAAEEEMEKAGAEAVVCAIAKSPDQREWKEAKG